MVSCCLIPRLYAVYVDCRSLTRRSTLWLSSLTPPPGHLTWPPSLDQTAEFEVKARVAAQPCCPGPLPASADGAIALTLAPLMEFPASSVVS